MTNVTLARRYLGDLWSHRGLESMAELVAPSCTVRDPLAGDLVGIEALTAHVRQLRRAFPDLSWTIDEVLADAGPQLALTWSARGTHRGPLAGIAATGQPIRVSGLLLLRFERNQLVAITTRWDPQDLLRQLMTATPPRPPRIARGSTPAMSTRPSADSELDAQWEL